VLVIGAAWPVPNKEIHPVRVVKNWFFLIGAVIMLLFAFLGYLQGGSVFFVFLEVLTIIASILMMLDLDDRIDAGVLIVVGGVLAAWSLV